MTRKTSDLKLRNILTFIKHWREKGWKETAKQWKYNYFMLETPLSINSKQLAGNIGMMVGFVMSAIFIFLQGLWYFGFAMAFASLLSYAGFKQTMQQRIILKDNIELMKEIMKEQGMEVEDDKCVQS